MSECDGGGLMIRDCKKVIETGTSGKTISVNYAKIWDYFERI